MEQIIRYAADLIGLDRNELYSQLGRKIRLMRYRDIDYIVFKTAYKRVGEGTAIIVKNGKAILVPPYPHIRRLAFIEAIPKYMSEPFPVLGHCRSC
ncbi:MAG: hypothetical protein J7K21_00450 [Desulfurococcales archaeon]|nr:hypothetical protein [Desulfurococcales archaeon]